MQGNAPEPAIANGGRRGDVAALATRFVPGAATTRVIKKAVDAIRKAQRALWDELRVIAEPAGATGLAALMTGAYRRAAGERVATLVCGANTEPGSVA